MLLSLFRSFYIQNYPDGMEQCIDTFSVFGGYNKAINLDTDIDTLITTHILENYGELYNSIMNLISDDKDTIRLLSAIAIGDRRTHSAYKRAHLSTSRGDIALEMLLHNRIITLERSREHSPKRSYPKQHLKREVLKHKISHKLRFNNPFLRFWFYFIMPNHNSIQKGDFETVLELYNQHKQSFSAYIFEELSNLLLLKITHYKIISSGSYWDRQVEIDLLAVNERGEIIVGECKWKNHKVNKKELHKLEEKCAKLGFEPKCIALFSKRGFSNELLQIAGKSLKLYSAEDFKLLLSDIKSSEILPSSF